VVAFFAPLARSFAGLKVSADVTGGFDTRLITCLLCRAGADLETAIAGMADARDVRIAAEIAQLLERPFFVTPHDLSRLEEELPQVFRDGDGQIDCCIFHRLRQHCLARLARGVQVISHGGGCELYGDFYGSQDFPRYGSSVVNFERYYDLRIAPVSVPRRYLSAKGAALLAQVRPRTLAKFAEFKAATNNESYDRVAYFVRFSEVWGRPYSNYINLGLDVVAPFCDWRNVRAAMSFPPWRKFRNGWHRQVLTAHCPRLAALRTTEGFSASTELRHLLPDIAGYLGMKSLRMARKASQRLLGRTLFDTQRPPNAPGLIPAARASSAFSMALDALKGGGLFAPALKPEDIKDKDVGRVLTLGLFLRHVGQHG
jgi:Asparagine synthase